MFELFPKRYAPNPVNHMTIGYATHLSVPPSPSIGIKNSAVKRKKSPITPRQIEMYLKGESNTFEEVMAAIPPEIKVKFPCIK